VGIYKEWIGRVYGEWLALVDRNMYGGAVSAIYLAICCRAAGSCERRAAVQQNESIE